MKKFMALGIGAFLGTLATAAQGVTLDVCPSGCTYSTIQSAVDAAVAGDVIDIAAGTYAGDVDIDTPDLTIQGAGAGSTIVEGLGFASFIFRAAASPAALSDVTLTSPVSMGCLYNYGAALTVRDSVLEDCTANFVLGPQYVGGAIYSTGDLTLRRVTARNNSAPGGLGGALYMGWDPAIDVPVLRIFDSEFTGNEALSGGAIYLDTDVVAFIDNTQFVDNAADGQTVSNNYDGLGGAIYSAGELTVTNSTLDGNFADESGGGIAVFGDQDTRIANSIFTNNSTTFLFAIPPEFTGGGLFVESDGKVTVSGTLFEGNTARTGGAIGSYNLVTGGAITVRGSSLVSNTALFGGGVYALGGQPTVIKRSTISGNLATALGGGGGVVAALASTVDLRSTTISGNTSEASAGGVYDDGGLINLRNTIIAGNTAMVAGAGGSTDDCGGFLYSDDFNLIGTLDGCVMTPEPNDLTGTDPAPIDALLLPPADNGPPTPTMLPDVGSPALDSGGMCSVRDQRGLLRPADGGTGVVQCDRGAVEVDADCIGPGLPGIVEPAAGSVVDAGRPLLTWTPAKSAASYDVRLLSRPSLFTLTLIAASNGRTATNWRPSVSLTANGDYAWRVIAHSHCGGVTLGPLINFTAQ